MGISENATEAEIENNYKSKAAKCYPENSAARNDELFRKLSAAYNILIDIKSRELYNQLLERERKGSAWGPSETKTFHDDFSESSSFEDEIQIQESDDFFGDEFESININNELESINTNNEFNTEISDLAMQPMTDLDLPMAESLRLFHNVFHFDIDDAPKLSNTITNM